MAINDIWVVVIPIIDNIQATPMNKLFMSAKISNATIIFFTFIPLTLFAKFK